MPRRISPLDHEMIGGQWKGWETTGQDYQHQGGICQLWGCSVLQLACRLHVMVYGYIWSQLCYRLLQILWNRWPNWGALLQEVVHAHLANKATKAEKWIGSQLNSSNLWALWGAQRLYAKATQGQRVIGQQGIQQSEAHCVTEAAKLQELCNHQVSDGAFAGNYAKNRGRTKSSASSRDRNRTQSHCNVSHKDSDQELQEKVSRAHSQVL